MNQRFLNHIHTKNFFLPKDKILLALSGGVDSMVLFHLLLNNKIEFAAAHINHNTRNGQSDEDAVFVENQCSKHGIELHLMTLDTIENTSNFQAYARDERYKFMKDLGYNKILTAHHSDDNLETVLLHFFTGRSTNPIPEVNHNIIRPLMFLSKNEIIEYANENNIDFVEDESNSSNAYDRNYLRNEIIPPLESHFTHLKKRILRLSRQINENDVLLSQCATELLELELKDNKFLIDKSKLSEGKSLLLYHGTKQFGFNRVQCQEIIYSINEVGKQFFSEQYVLLVDRNKLIIAKKSVQFEAKDINLNELPKTVSYGQYLFSFTLAQGQNEDADRNTIFCDKTKIGEFIKIRSWNQGDIFHPAGMDGHSQSLKKYFANNKIDRLQKKEIPLLCTKEDQIIWIAGYRQDERYISNSDQPGVVQIRVRKMD